MKIVDDAVYEKFQGEKLFKLYVNIIFTVSTPANRKSETIATAAFLLIFKNFLKMLSS